MITEQTKTFITQFWKNDTLHSGEIKAATRLEADLSCPLGHLVVGELLYESEEPKSGSFFHIIYHQALA